MHLVQIGNQYVFRFNVSMNYVSVLEVNEGVNDLSYDDFALIFAKELFSPQFLVEVSILTIFKHYVDVGLVIKVSIEFDNVRMVKPPLYFEFPLHLREKVKLFQHSFEYDLKCDWKVRILFSSLEDLSKFATANRLDAIEIVDSPTL